MKSIDSDDWFSDIVAADEKKTKKNFHGAHPSHTKTRRGNVIGEKKQFGQRAEVDFEPKRMRCVSVHKSVTGKVIALFKDPCSDRRVQQDVRNWPTSDQVLAANDAAGTLTIEQSPVWEEHKRGAIRLVEGASWIAGNNELHTSV